MPVLRLPSIAPITHVCPSTHQYVPSTILSIGSPFFSDSPEGHRLVEDTSIRCYDLSHSAVMAVSLLFIAMWVIYLPVVIFTGISTFF